MVTYQRLIINHFVKIYQSGVYSLLFRLDLLLERESSISGSVSDRWRSWHAESIFRWVSHCAIATFIDSQRGLGFDLMNDSWVRKFFKSEFVRRGFFVVAHPVVDSLGGQNREIVFLPSTEILKQFTFKFGHCKWHSWNSAFMKRGARWVLLIRPTELTFFYSSSAMRALTPSLKNMSG